MKKVIYWPLLFFSAITVFVGCNNDDDPNPNPNVDFSKVQVEDFIWKGLNFYYLWKDDVADLADSKDDDNTAYFNFLDAAGDPEDFFESLLFQYGSVDKWSWFIDDYIEQENSFSGISKSNGIVYRLAYETNSSTNLLAYVRYILPNSDASDKDVKRGDVFNSIDGTQMTINNYQALLGADTYTINFGDLNGGNPILNGKSIEFTKEEYQENPIFIKKTFDIGGQKIGYLMYNRFNSVFDLELNAAFGEFKSEGISDLIVDLRYNPGGYSSTAVYLSSMITGQFTGELIVKEHWNAEWQAWFEANRPEWIENRFTTQISKTIDGSPVTETINSLNLSKVHFITTSSSASASEFVMSGLDPYIDVVTIGTTSSGKYTGSITVYDSDNFQRNGDNLNTTHKNAMQPIVFQYRNKNNVTVQNGIAPSIEIVEYVSQFKPLGDPTEPLLQEALNAITASSKLVPEKFEPGIELREVEIDDLNSRLIKDKGLPAGIRNQ